MKFFLLSLCFFASQAFAASDNLGQGKVRYSAPQPKAFAESKLANLRDVLGNFRIVLDSTTKVTSPLRVGGTAANPTLKVSVEKCVFIVCKSVDIDIEFSVETTRGNCELNLVLVGDLSRSSGMITDYYSQLQFPVCYNTSSDGKSGELAISGVAVRSENFESGLVQGQMLQMFKRQLPSIVEAVRKSLNGSAMTNSIRRVRPMIAPLF